MSLTELSNELSKSFDACLESILSDPQQKEQEEETNGGLDAQLATLKSSFLEIENQLKEIRLKALGSKELSVTESNKLLKRDIDIKKSTIAKYATKIETWEKELPVLKENSEKAVALRTDGTDFDSDIVVVPETITTDPETTAKDNHAADDNDEDEDVEFEEV
ncbi:hypothetical protein [Parasitella parasitica]|uniref:Uncharacterized protein n=1 Tax=Parasitella parasitica TaxID=35722 RepID=A0A0B7NU47_9FUNG|nr:hypothetical protein [Parasitella parasitica]